MADLVLGTAQFGLDYGVTNQNGAVNNEDLAAMLNFAAEAGISQFDTAADYGNAQNRLGTFWPETAKNVIFTKFSLDQIGQVPSADNLFLNSMADLKVDGLGGLLLHKVENLTDERFPRALEILRSAREAGTIGRLGVSVYSIEDLDKALGVIPDLDILQLPSNVLSLDMLRSPEVTRLHNRGCLVHVRSIFLQGVLLAEPSSLPEAFGDILPALHYLRHEAKTAGVSVLELLISSMKNEENLDGLVVGATNASELEEILQAWNSDNLPIGLSMPRVPESLLDPRTWPPARI